MLEPTTTPPIRDIAQPKRTGIPEVEDSLTDGYGEPSHDVRSASGGVDFFSSLGTERRRKPPPKLEEVSLRHRYGCLKRLQISISPRSVIGSSM